MTVTNYLIGCIFNLFIFGGNSIWVKVKTQTNFLNSMGSFSPYPTPNNEPPGPHR